MRTIHTQLAIEAPAATVWAILADTARWPEWNPFILRLDGTLAIGAGLTARIKPPGKSAMTFTPRVVAFEPGREFRWLGTLGIRGLFDGEHGFRVTPDGTARCRFEQFESFTGLLVAPLLWIAEAPTRAGFVAMNEALKARAESR